jgi:hypothetical protein
MPMQFRHHVTAEGFDVLDCSPWISRAGLLACVDSANSEICGGFRDWVAPDSMTLCLLHYASTELRDGLVYWSASTAVGRPYEGQSVSSVSRLVTLREEREAAPVRLVRQSQAAEIARLGHRQAMREAGIDAA